MGCSNMERCVSHKILGIDVCSIPDQEVSMLNVAVFGSLSTTTTTINKQTTTTITTTFLLATHVM